MKACQDSLKRRIQPGMNDWRKPTNPMPIETKVNKHPLSLAIRTVKTVALTNHQ